MDRKANCPSYRKRLSVASLVQQNNSENDSSQNDSCKQLSEGGGGGGDMSAQEVADEAEKDMYNTCCVMNCSDVVAHSLRKKWISKMKKQVSKIIELDNDMINDSLTLIPICDTHYQAISHLMVCAMCKRRLPKNHIYFIAQVSDETPFLVRLSDFFF